VLAGEGPRAVDVPVVQPFFPGWSEDLSGRTPVEPAAKPRPGAAQIPEQVWDARLQLAPPLELGGPAVDRATGDVFVGTMAGRLFRFHGGRAVWSLDVGAPIVAAPAVFEESVVVGTGAGVLLVFNKQTGERRARAILGEELVTQPVLVPAGDGTVLAFVGSGAESLFAVTLDLRKKGEETARKLWRAHRDPPPGFTVRGFARPVPAGDTVFSGFADGFVTALDAATGVARWERRVSPAGDLTDVDALAFNGHTLFAASYSGGVHALDPAGGATLWRTPLAGATRVRLDGPWLYAVAPGNLLALRAGDGKPVWTFRIPDQRAGSTPVLTPEIIAIAASGGPVYFLDRRSGAPEGVLGTGDGVSSQPALDGAALYVLSDAGRLYSAGLLR